MKMLKTTFVFLAIILLFTGCYFKSGTTNNTITTFALDTTITGTVTDKNDYSALSSAMNLISEYENLFSKTISTSDISKINTQKDVDISTLNQKTVEILKIANDISLKTNGAFDFTLSNISDLWQFTSDTPHIPTSDELSLAIQNSGYQNFIMDSKKIMLKNNINIDLGGIAKGYITDLLVTNLKENNVKSAILSLGGNVYVIGNKNGNPWKVGIANPNSPNDIVGYVSVENKAVVTSGIYQRFFEKDGTIYHHILDGKTGYPAISGLKSVTVISDNSTLADAYSTAFFVMGVNNAMEYLKKNNITDIDVIFITQSDEIIYTENAKNYFTIDN